MDRIPVRLQAAAFNSPSVPYTMGHLSDARSSGRNVRTRDAIDSIARRLISGAWRTGSSELYILRMMDGKEWQFGHNRRACLHPRTVRFVGAECPPRRKGREEGDGGEDGDGEDGKMPLCEIPINTGSNLLENT